MTIPLAMRNWGEAEKLASMASPKVFWVRWLGHYLLNFLLGKKLGGRRSRSFCLLPPHLFFRRCLIRRKIFSFPWKMWRKIMDKNAANTYYDGEREKGKLKEGEKKYQANPYHFSPFFQLNFFPSRDSSLPIPAHFYCIFNLIIYAFLTPSLSRSRNPRRV